MQIAPPQTQDKSRPSFQPSPNALYYSIDVECVATATDHNSRAVAHVALVDQYERVLLNVYVLPDKPVASYLTPLTGLTKEILEEYGVPFEQAVNAVKQTLPKSAVLVGQNIGQDVGWLGLKQGQDFESLLDLAGLYRVWNTQYNSWSIFGQDHVAKVLLGWDGDGQNHNAVQDAAKSMRLFNLYLQLHKSDSELEQAQQSLLSTQAEPSFARRYPTFEGVCMGNRKTCTCGAPFFS